MARSPTTHGIPANGFSNTPITKVILVRLFGMTQVSLLNMNTQFPGENKNKKQKSAIGFFIQLWRGIARFDFISLFSFSSLFDRLWSFSCVVGFVHMMVSVCRCFSLHDGDDGDVFGFSIKYPLDYQIVSLNDLGSKHRAYVSTSPSKKKCVRSSSTGVVRGWNPQARGPHIKSSTKAFFRVNATTTSTQRFNRR